MAFRLAGRKGNSEKGKRWFAIFVGVIMLMSVAGFVFSLNPSGQGVNFRYGGLILKQSPEGFYTAELNGIRIDFLHRPEDLADVEVSPDILGKITGSRSIQVTYYWNSTFSDDMALFQFDVSNLLDSKYGVFVEPGFTTANPSNTRIVSCNDATPFVPVLLLQEANNTALGIDSSNPDCIVLNASGIAGFSRAADKLKYAVLGSGNSVSGNQ
ncbi:hypothetical protein HYY73_03280 [Candidatus Woesearchaeota archaeon]|nr:hypothetical protein [Candidatus Woesearchaeota archaeon]